MKLTRNNPHEHPAAIAYFDAGVDDDYHMQNLVDALISRSPDRTANAANDYAGVFKESNHSARKLIAEMGDSNPFPDLPHEISAYNDLEWTLRGLALAVKGDRSSLTAHRATRKDLASVSDALDTIARHGMIPERMTAVYEALQDETASSEQRDDIEKHLDWVAYRYETNSS